MAIEDLDLEFEEENGEGKSGGDAVDIDIDLSFSASPEDDVKGAIKGVKGKPQPKKSPVKKSTGTKPQMKVVDNKKATGTIEVSDTITDMRPTPEFGLPSQQQPARSGNTAQNIQVSVDSDNLQHEIAFLKNQIQNLQEQLHHTRSQADVRVAVAENEKNYLVEYVSNAKVLDVQITQVLLKMNAKAPAVKAESQLIKKMINEFLQKSNPKK